MIYGVTGTRKIAPEQNIIVRKAIEELDDIDTLITGGAYGVDTQAAYAGYLYHRNCHRLIYIPKGKWHNPVTYEYGEVFPVAGGYMARNQAIADDCDILLAFPQTADEQWRSGTWATVRKARKANKEVIILPIN